jgi:hypothetical protein
MINRMIQRLFPPTLEKALEIAHAIGTWKTRRGTPLKPTTKSGLMSALSMAAKAVANIDLTQNIVFRGLTRSVKKECALHVRRQAVPATLSDVRSAVRDGATELLVRQASWRGAWRCDTWT